MPEEREVAATRSPAPVFDMALYPDISHFEAAANTGRRQDLNGFDRDYVDIVDYIVRCTHKIWEESAIGLIYTHYSHNAAIVTSEGLSYGRDAWLARSIQKLAAFPDRRAYTHDVIWSGNDQDGFHTSHLVYSVGTNTGHSHYGPPTGRRVGSWVISNCLVKENRIVAEWVVHDAALEIRQLGLNPMELASQVVLSTDQNVANGDIERLQGQKPPPVWKDTGGTFDIEDFIRGTAHDIWNWRLLNRVRERFAENYWCKTVSGRELYGWGDYKAFVLGLLAAFPDGKMTIDDLYWLGEEAAGYRVAARWTLIGTHEGPGVYGLPTGKRVRIMGISHYHVKNGRIVGEFTLFDEFALLKRLHGRDSDN